MILRRRYKINSSSNYTYKELEYIENPNRIRILLNIKAMNNHYGFEAKFKCNQNDLDIVENNGSQIDICGFVDRNSALLQQTYTKLYLRKYSNIDYFTVQMNAGIYTYPAGHAREGEQVCDSSAYYGCGPSDDSIHIFKITYNSTVARYQAYLDGTMKINTTTGKINENPVVVGVNYHIFGTSATAGATGNSNSRIYYFKAYDDQENLIANLIPVKKMSDNKIGLYDTLNDVLYHGNFTAGPDVGPLVVS